jgi:hypothetical protein
VIRPLYRWKSFWFGVLVIGFLGWAWFRSTTMADYLLMDWPAGEFAQVHHTSGRMKIYRSLKAPVFSSPEFKFMEDAAEVESLKLPLGIRYSPFSEGSSILSVTHWFVILLFLVPWSGWLVWRWRRMKRGLPSR